MTFQRLLSSLTVVALLGTSAAWSAAARQAAQPAAQQKQQPVNPSQPPPPPPEPPPRGQRPVIRAAADLVLIDVQVGDRDGKPVKGLNPEQFKVYEDNAEQKVDSFEYYDVEAIETASAANAQAVVVQLGAVSQPDAVREAVRDRRLMVLFFDKSSLQPDELARAVVSSQRYIAEQMTPADLVAVVAFGNTLQVLAPFTNDRNMLEAAIRRLRPGMESLAASAPGDTATGEEAVSEDTGDAFTADETEFNIFNTDRKLAAIEGLAELLKDLPGKKSVIQFSGGITQTGQENRSQLRATTDAANRSNVSFYTVDARGLVASAPGGDANAGGAAGQAMFSGQAVFRQSSSRQDSRETLATLAVDTGGKSFTDVGDFSEVFREVQKDLSGYYLLGYYSKNAKRDGKWRRVRVRVDVPNVRVTNREGYYAPKSFQIFTTEDRERQLEEAMRAEAPRVELALALETEQFRLSADEVFVPIAAKLASSALDWAEKQGKRETEFDFAAEILDARNGRSVGALRDTIKVKLDAERFQSIRQQAIVYQGGVIVAPGSYRMKFLVRENESGRIGTFEQSIEVPSADRDELQLSTLLLSSQVQALPKDAEVEKKALAVDARMKRSPLEVGGERIIPSVTRVFTTKQRLYVFFQAYYPSKADGDKLLAGLVFFRNGRRQFETPMVEAAEVDAKTRTASFRISLPLEKMATGRYSVQAVVVEPGGELAAFAGSYLALRPPVQQPDANAAEVRPPRE